MQNINKRSFIEYLIYLSWSMITVTSFPFFIGSMIESDFQALPLTIVGFTWFVLLTIIIVKLKDKGNPLYRMLTKHALVGGLTQLLTSFPAYILIALEPDFDFMFSIDGMIVIWVLSSIIASIAMSVYDIKLIKQFLRLCGVSEQVKSYDVGAYFIGVLFLTIVFSGLLVDDSGSFVGAIPFAGVVALVAAFYLLVVYQVIFAIIQINQQLVE